MEFIVSKESGVSPEVESIECEEFTRLLRAVGNNWGRAFDEPTIDNLVTFINNRLKRQVADYEEVLADHRRLVREIDVALNGEDGAAKQASLCDILMQVTNLMKIAKMTVALEQERNELKAKLAQNRPAVATYRSEGAGDLVAGQPESRINRTWWATMDIGWICDFLDHESVFSGKKLRAAWDEMKALALSVNLQPSVRVASTSADVNRVIAVDLALAAKRDQKELSRDDVANALVAMDSFTQSGRDSLLHGETFPFYLDELAALVNFINKEQA